MFRRLLIAAALHLPVVAFAGDPIVVTETTTSGTPGIAVFGAHSIVRATDDLILGRGPAAGLAGRDVTATFNIAGVSDALRFTLSADRTTATLTYPHTGAVASFTSGSTRSFYTPANSIDDQIYNSITSEENQQWGSLQEQLNRQSYIMPGDGNPSAATAFLAKDTFNRYALMNETAPPGFDQSDFTVYDSGHGPRNIDYFQPIYSFAVNGDSIETNGFSGYDVGFTFNATGRIAPVVGWSVSVPYRYRSIDGARDETVGIEGGLPLWLVRRGRHQPVSWTLTPFIEFAYDDGRNLGNESLLFDGGVASRLSVHFGRRSDWALSWGSQFTGFTDIHATNHGYDNGEFDGDYYYYNDSTYTDMFRSHVSQQLFRNALEVAHRFRHGWSVDFSVAYSSFVQDAAVDQWWSPRLGLGWQIGDHVGLHLDYEADLANHYHSQGGRFDFEMRY